ncbi:MULTISPECIES: alpha/beta fold hydrolase [unclassified Sporosarcina]|uniref:alpha/beta fold hydrolase n=1 Tax=unclassified Sporosarcina TaxID=2647733 RepID=UPI000C164568|nr:MULTISPECIES: alpha/beta hydrolase [unclassified Sporosarcina]PID05692.1 alpha/beta hydrolase [Sporosarcina sp. P30]PID08886.1 alpha/beta hydrolase [Sporosarcina sp. P31]PID11877.1 alpha/beta hydrolase [Sporosarcina sp. P32b]
MPKYAENLVLIPGLNNTKQTWDGVLEALPKTINAFPVDVPAIPNIDDIAKDLLKDLPEKFHLVGHSFGGFVALAILANAPERVSALSLVGTNAEADSETGKEFRKKAIARVEAGEYEDMVNAAAHRTFHPDNLDNAELQEIREQMLIDYGPDRYIAHAKAIMNKPDRGSLLANTDIPYLFIASKDDLVIPLESTKAMLEYAPNAVFKTIEKTGHLAPLEQPEALTEILLPWLEI